MSTILAAQKAMPAPAVARDAELRERLEHYYYAADKHLWWKSQSFKQFWKKFERGVAQELELARVFSHWIDFRSARVLVIGSYLGAEAVAYALCGARVVGIDLDEEAMTVSQALAERHGVKIEVCARDACNTGFRDASFDFISCAQVLEHLPPHVQPAMLREIWRLCKPGGHFWIDTPNQMKWIDQHDTGLPFIHWLPRRLKVPLARMLGRAVTIREPALGEEPVYLHYYLSYFKLRRILSDLGPHRVLSKYRGYASADHYCAGRKQQGRGRGALFPLKVALMRQLLKVWNWNWFGSTRLMIQKV
jgi:2-polyprenyl-3-methyl-5-hydroxy-6-metoxy-1,4-benzoquinol methylase